MKDTMNFAGYTTVVPTVLLPPHLLLEGTSIDGTIENGDDSDIEALRVLNHQQTLHIVAKFIEDENYITQFGKGQTQCKLFLFDVQGDGFDTEYELMGTGYARCANNEKFDRITGRRIALERALQDAGNHQFERIQFLAKHNTVYRLVKYNLEELAGNQARMAALLPFGPSREVDIAVNKGLGNLRAEQARLEQMERQSKEQQLSRTNNDRAFEALDEERKRMGYQKCSLCQRHHLRPKTVVANNNPNGVSLADELKSSMGVDTMKRPPSVLRQDSNKGDTGKTYDPVNDGPPEGIEEFVNTLLFGSPFAKRGR